jgi:type I restriction enzyme S subunit
MKINNQRVLIDPISIPEIGEQRKIVSFLTSVDQKIELVRNQLEHAKEFKKGLLQQMFV